MKTKFYAPSMRKVYIRRPHLIEKLNAGLDDRLTLISAPAGFGKSTLVTDWLSQAKRPFVWLSLDEDDNDLIRFFTYAAAALQQIDGVNSTTRRLLRSSQSIKPRSLVTALINDCMSATTPFILALDDYHNITDPAVNHAVTFLLDNMPANLHLALTSRVDPLLPISRLRARRQMKELRTEDLRFTPEEAAAFLRNVMGLNLTIEQSSALETRTEGWIAGLQMAALSIQGFKSEEIIAKFVADFTGSHRYIFDYLTDEVLYQQPEDIQDFLMLTSILNQFNASLCNTVTGQKNSKQILRNLESANMFLFPLDENREWYRYHHLFADLLHQRLLSRYPEKVPELYRRASHWYAEHNEIEPAVLYALDGNHVTEAARLLDEAAFEIIGKSEHKKLRDLLDKLPTAIQCRYPRLDLAQGWLSMFFAEYDLAEKYLTQAEANFALPSYLSAEFPVELGNAYIAMIRAYSATRRGYLSKAIAFSEEAMAWLVNIPEKNAQVLRGTILINLGQTQVAVDEIEKAAATYEQAIIDSQASNRVSAVMASYTCLMDLERRRGRLGTAKSVGHQGLTWLTNFRQHDAQTYTSEGEIRAQLGLIYYEQNQLSEARKHLDRSLILYRSTNNQMYASCLHYMFLVELAEGDFEKAVQIHQEITPILNEFPPILYQRHLTNCIVRIRRLCRVQPREKLWPQELRFWLNTFEVHQSVSINTRYEPQILIKAKVLADMGNLEDSIALLEHLANAAESASRFGDLIQYRVQQSLILMRLSQRELALVCLKHAVYLAESGNYLRAFLDEMEGLSPLFCQLPQSPYRDEVISHFDQTDHFAPALPTIMPEGHTGDFDPLSKRELEVLVLLTSHLSGPEIAAHLNISINTYKTHIKNIYSKLGVNSRNDAVVCAKELGLL